jgi:hypothetical protein
MAASCGPSAMPGATMFAHIGMLKALHVGKHLARFI